MIWGLGQEYDKHINALKYQEVMKKIYVVGITSKEDCYDYVDGYQYYPCSCIANLNFDCLVIAANETNYAEILAQVNRLRLDKKDVIRISLFSIPNFDLDKYLLLRNSNMSIISMNCWGGITSHKLGLQFNSPFVNLFIREKYFIELCKNLKDYLSKELEFCRWEERDGNMFPVMRLGTIELFFLHYHSVEEAKAKWNRRVKRINYDNLFFVMFTNNADVLEAFDEIPYKKKICFVPFQSKVASAYSLNISKKLENKPFFEIVNALAWGNLKEYDVLDLLLCRKGKRIEEM